MTRKAAFTLIELTLVTVIILTLIGLSIPLFRKTFTNLSSRNAAFNISKLVTYAQEKAIIDRKNYKLVFDFGRREYRLFESTSSDGKLVYKKIKGRFGKGFTLPQGLYFDGSGASAGRTSTEKTVKQIVFYPDGRCDELSIEVTDNKDAGCRITLEGFGHLPRVEEIAHEG